jgi:hypothetical protein
MAHEAYYPGVRSNLRFIAPHFVATRETQRNLTCSSHIGLDHV